MTWRMCSELMKSCSTCHAQGLTLVAERMGAANPAVVNLEVGSCTHQRSASVAVHGNEACFGASTKLLISCKAVIHAKHSSSP